MPSRHVGTQDVSAVERQLSSLQLSFSRVLLESPEARRALRSLLDELDRTHPLAPQPRPQRQQSPVRSPSPAPARAPQPSPSPSAFEFEPFYRYNPKGYAWALVATRPKPRQMVYERAFPDGAVRLTCYETGTVMLLYDNPDYNSQWPTTPRRLQETFRGLDDPEFRSMLLRPQYWFGRGYGTYFSGPYYSSDDD